MMFFAENRTAHSEPHAARRAPGTDPSPRRGRRTTGHAAKGTGCCGKTHFPKQGGVIVLILAVILVSPAYAADCEFVQRRLRDLRIDQEKKMARAMDNFAATKSSSGLPADVVSRFQDSLQKSARAYDEFYANMAKQLQSCTICVFDPSSKRLVGNGCQYDDWPK